MLKKFIVFPIILITLHFNVITSYAEEPQETTNTTEQNIEAVQNTNEIQNTTEVAALEEPTEAVVSPTDLDPTIKQYCQEAAQEFDINEYVLESLIYTESRGASDAKNGRFIGLTQLYPKYFTSVMETLNITDPYAPRSNIRICAYKLSEWSKKYNIYMSLDCWHNGESGAVKRNKVQGTYYSQTIYANAVMLATTDTISNPNMSETEKIENVTNNKNI